ncbi:16S rRNA m(7)G-527 methyltransferase [Sphingomonas guangdongensis]|uniref:Ribosomal RNA small subunit methyltransferase G n=1 Tax=Sphingomonas guangdongensis TaxID=1141890 RepID=A0A285QG72_9SPHN|nr:16S rRNA (guanine(527)-N(7))-methyltransferase RsmG [Sphingomonas guangdongensis]SOB80429.1 16S rRNA m(7)G-527 methyltransferase [Sphingomonas guangdongensis]
MNEEEAQGWCAAQFGTPALDRLRRYVDLLTAESERQNLIAPSTKEAMWTRHIVDSAQLLRLAVEPSAGATWVDIGSGAGLPGLVIAAASNWSVVLIEPRRLRVAFLEAAAKDLDLDHRVTIIGRSADRVTLPKAAIVSARAVAKTDRLFADARGFAGLSTVFLLPKGASASVELENARQTWQGEFHVEHSLTDPAAGIIVATQVRPR